MEKIVLIAMILLAALSSIRAAFVFSDSFNYPDGGLVANSGGIWTAHASAGSNPILVTNGQIIVREISASAEDDHVDLPGNPYTTNSGITLYTSYKLTALSLPTVFGTYISHYRDTNTGAPTGFGARVFLSATNAVSGGLPAAGKFRIGIGNGNAAGVTNGQYDMDLDTNTTYTVVTRFVLATGISTLWINPNSESDPSVTATDIGTNGVSNAINVVSYCFRQGSQTPSGSSTNLIDDLKIGTAFTDVAGANTAPTISPIATQNMPASTTLGPISFTVGDAESPASSLTLSNASSNVALVPTSNIVFGGSGSKPHGHNNACCRAAGLHYDHPLC